MEIKYEAVFGDQALFNDSGMHINIIRYNRKIGLYFKDSLNNLSGSLLEQPIVAMRRIIRTPTWTVADQKAGKLPEVGCRVLYARNGLNGEIVSIDDSDVDDVELCLRFKDKSLLVCKMNLVKPIESPEEKSARLREEWCSNALGSASILSGMREYELKRLGGYIENIYDALLSGDLPVPGKGE